MSDELVMRFYGFTKERNQCQFECHALGVMYRELLNDQFLSVSTASSVFTKLFPFYFLLLYPLSFILCPFPKDVVIRIPRVTGVRNHINLLKQGLVRFMYFSGAAIRLRERVNERYPCQFECHA